MDNLSIKEEKKLKKEKPKKEEKKKPKKEEKKEEKKKPKKEKKKEEYIVVLDKEVLEQIETLKVELVFINNSLLKDEKIINGMIYQYKILPYKCCNSKCSIINEWLSNSINLLLVRKNNKQQDLRIGNLEYSCYNCYFQKNNNKNIFNKIKKTAILECQICKFNINNLPDIYKDLGMCKLCLSQHKSRNTNTRQLDLFRNTFTNSLTSEDIDNEYNSKTPNNYINGMNDIDNISMFLNNMNNDDYITEETYEDIFNKVSMKSNENKETQQNKTKNKDNTSNTINNEKETIKPKININIGSMDINTINQVKKIMEE